MNKKGFTLIELLAVIIVIALVALIAVPSIGGITKKIQENMLDKKKEMILKAAELYGEDYRTTINGNITIDGKSYKCKTIKVSDLVKDKKLESDTGALCLGNGGTGCIVNPVDDKTFLDRDEIIIYVKNRRIRAIYKTGTSYVCR